LGYYTTEGTKILKIKAIKLQMPIDVALFKKGNTVSST
jgi:hypothetical protein